MIPAVEAADCAGFGEAVYEFGRLAGACFAPAQGGTFASPSIERLVNAIREFGVAGAGQSSWGPTVFAVVPSDAEAASLAAWLRNQLADDESEIMVAAPNNCGATLRS
jgi:predicted sugar kinase